ncbi:hypothetical protein GQ53DRAFT_743447 [Thozetella sp. PMI_491]|nr:hypothetical protein GQ53DRAFT_743447 [Thozetella sp. PMI_491]
MRLTVSSTITVLLTPILSCPVTVVEKVGEPMLADNASLYNKIVALAESVSSLDSRDSATDRKNALGAHNSARSAVGVATLVWDDALHLSAEAYAQELAKTPGGHLVHSRAGENLCWRSNITPNDLLLGRPS